MSGNERVIDIECVYHITIYVIQNDKDNTLYYNNKTLYCWGKYITINEEINQVSGVGRIWLFYVLNDGDCLSSGQY